MRGQSAPKNIAPSSWSPFQRQSSSASFCPHAGRSLPTPRADVHYYAECANDRTALLQSLSHPTRGQPRVATSHNLRSLRRGSSLVMLPAEWGSPAKMPETSRRRVAKDPLRGAGARLSVLACAGILTLLTACGQENRFVAPPPPTVIVQLPLQQTVTAPFDGVVTARKVSVGELVGGDHTSELATIVQIDPIWVWFNLSERDVQRVRAQMAERAVTIADLINKVPIEVGLQTETGYPHKGVLDYSAPDVNQSTGTLQVRGIFENAKQALLPGYFVRVRVPLRPEQALLVPEVAVGADQAGRYVLTVNADSIVEQRRAQLGQTTGEMRVIESGLKPDERRVVSGILDASPGPDW